MLPNERKERIKDLVKSQHSIRIAELSELLGVSEMTIHRDIKSLVEEGVVVKTFGGITLGRKELKDLPESDNCVYCHRKIDNRLSYRLILSDNRVESTCCAHCGLLRHHQLRDQVIQAICHDFLFHTTISALQAWFVMDAGLDIGCCQPQILVFRKRDNADGFVKGFGGRVLSFTEAVERVHTEMGCCK